MRSGLRPRVTALLMLFVLLSGMFNAYAQEIEDPADPEMPGGSSGSPEIGELAERERDLLNLPDAPEAQLAVAGEIPIPEMPVVEDISRTASIRIRAIGDVMLHQKQLDDALQKDGSYDFTPAFQYVKGSLSDADLTIANLETTIGMYKDSPYSGYPRFNSPESFLDALKDAGIDHLTLANNHMLDRYFTGLNNTVNNVRAAGFSYSGAFLTREERKQPCIVEVQGIRLGFLSYTEGTNGAERGCSSEVKEFAVPYLKTADFEGDVRRLREAGADLVIALPHWGSEYKRRPDTTSRGWAKKLIKAGVDVILGSHSHTVHPIEWVTYEGKTALVAWSMGNFIANMVRQYTYSSIIVEFTVSKAPDGTCTVSDVGYVPVYLWRRDGLNCAVCSGEYWDSRPKGMSDRDYRRMRNTAKEIMNLIGTKEFEVLPK